MTFDPFGDFESQGYLRNTFQEKDIEIVKDLENSVFSLNIVDAIQNLSQSPIDYESFKSTHKRLFEFLYPWAGTDRAETGPMIAIAKGGYDKLFCHLLAIKKASNYALRNINNPNFSPGDCFADLAHAHPFLDGNGRTILALHSEIMRRNNYHVEWNMTETPTFLKALTEDLNNPGKSIFQSYLEPFIKEGSLSLDDIGRRLKVFTETR